MSQRHHYNEPPPQPQKSRPTTLAELVHRGPSADNSLPPAAGSPTTHASPTSAAPLLSHGDAIATRPSEERVVLGMNNEAAHQVFRRRGEQQKRGSVSTY